MPDAIRTCLSLRELNVSYNMLNGSLPALSNLTALRLFDGSFNRFSGGVLSTSGEVPFFVTHDSVTERSFLNNSALCGSVLGIGCGSGGKLATSTIIYIAIGSAAGLIALLVLLFLLFTYRKGWNRKGSKHSSQVSAELQLKVTPDEILAATNEFNETG
jgi:LRR receptor-like serine/threonine-protein kinase FLS2